MHFQPGKIISNQDFQERLAKINAANAAEGRRAPRLPVYRADCRNAHNTQRSARLDLLLVPLTFVLGAALVLAGRLVMSHYLSDSNLLASLDVGLVRIGVGQDSGKLILTGLVGFLFLIHKAMMLCIRHGVGSSLILFKENLLMQHFQDLWSQLYSPLHVNQALFHLNATRNF